MREIPERLCFFLRTFTDLKSSNKLYQTSNRKKLGIPFAFSTNFIPKKIIMLNEKLFYLVFYRIKSFYDKLLLQNGIAVKLLVLKRKQSKVYTSTHK